MRIKNLTQHSFLILFICLLMFSFWQEAKAHSKTRTAYGQVLCLSYKGNSIDHKYCNPHTSTIGSKPARPTRSCSVSHDHDDNIDVDGDGRGDYRNAEDARRDGHSGGKKVDNCADCK